MFIGRNCHCEPAEPGCASVITRLAYVKEWDLTDDAIPDYTQPWGIYEDPDWDFYSKKQAEWRNGPLVLSAGSTLIKMHGVRFEPFLPLQNPQSWDAAPRHLNASHERAVAVYEQWRRSAHSDSLEEGTHITPSELSQITLHFKVITDIFDVGDTDLRKVNIRWARPVVNGTPVGPLTYVNHNCVFEAVTAYFYKDTSELVYNFLEFFPGTVIQVGDVLGIDVFIDVEHTRAEPATIAVPNLQFSLESYEYIAGTAPKLEEGKTYEINFGTSSMWTPLGGQVWKMDTDENVWTSATFPGDPGINHCEITIYHKDSTYFLNKRVRFTWDGERAVLSFHYLVDYLPGVTTSPFPVIQVNYQPKSNGSYANISGRGPGLPTYAQTGPFNPSGQTIFDLFSIEYYAPGLSEPYSIWGPDVLNPVDNNPIANIPDRITVTQVDRSSS